MHSVAEGLKKHHGVGKKLQRNKERCGANELKTRNSIAGNNRLTDNPMIAIAKVRPRGPSSFLLKSGTGLG
jgi:hypothetical protein